MLADGDSAVVVFSVEWIAHIRLHYPLLCCSDHLPCALQHAKRANTSLKECYGRNVFFKTRLFKDALPPVRSGCGRYLAPGDGHDRCLSCLGIEHAEAAFVDESCPHCGGMTVAGLRTRLRFLQRGGVPVPLPRSRPMELPRERAGPSHGGGVPLVSFGAPPDDRMSIATLEGESDQSGDDGSVPLPPSGRSAVPDSDPEMVAMLARAAESVGLEWRPPPCPEPSRLDDWFLGVARAGSNRAPPRCLSSRKCMMSSLEHGRHLSLPETAPVAHPPSPPLTAERRGGIRRSRRWSDRLRCNCVQGPLLPGAVIRCSPPGPVGTRRP